MMIKTYQCIRRSADTERNELNSPQPAHTLPANRKESHVEEEEGGHGVMRALRREVRHPAQNDHTGTHATGTKHCQNASAKVVIDAHNGDDRCNEEPSGAASCQE